MTDFEGVDLRARSSASRSLRGRFEGANFTDVRFSEVWFVNVEIDGMLAGLTINGVDVRVRDGRLARTIRSEGAHAADGSEGMPILGEVTARWDQTIERAQRLSGGTLRR
jgi:hypothetical protein